MLKKIKNSKIIRFEKSGHALFIEEKEKFNDELKKFASKRNYAPVVPGLYIGGRYCFDTTRLFILSAPAY
ncbi:MAG: hypothetical protein HQK50_03555 [Oligoflexia bacterium]|nr:hypothetical protein [Oligoflexia bacterium]